VSYTLLNMDCMDFMRDLPDNSVDAIITDPPYFRVKNEDWDNQWDSRGGFLQWVGQLCEQFQRILKPNGSLYFFASPQMSAHVEVKISVYFNVLSSITWRKGKECFSSVGWSRKTKKEALRSWLPETERIIFSEQYGDQYADAEKALHKEVYAPIGRYIQIERERSGLSRNDVELALGFVSSSDPTRGTALCYRWEEGSSLPTEETYSCLRSVLNASGGEYLRREYEDLRREYEDLRRPFNVSGKEQYSDVWFFAPVKPYRGKHPCEKPLPLMSHIIKSSTRLEDVVFDPFVGSGATGDACLRLGRKFIGTESKKSNYEAAKQRLENRQKQPRMFDLPLSDKQTEQTTML